LFSESILLSPDFQMPLLLFVALAGYLIAYRINQSAVVGIILAGILVGPSFLGLVTYTDFVSSLAHLGAVVLLFTIGLEFNIKEIAKVRYLVIGLCGVIIPAIGGFFTAELFGFDFKAAVFIGTALTATSIAITANVLREMGKLQTEAAKAIIAIAVVDDVLALLFLSMAEGVVSGNISVGTLLLTSFVAVAFIAIGIIVGKFVFARLAVTLSNTALGNKYPESIFIFTIMTAFLYALTAELVGLSAIVGSFLAGATFSGIKFKNSVKLKDGAEHLHIIFSSIFFVSLGVIMDTHYITLDIIWFILVLTVVAMITKFIGCGIPAKLYGMNWKDSLVVGVGMAPRGEVGMIIGLIGLNQGLIDMGVYSAIILVCLLTTIISPLIMRNGIYKH